MTRLGPTFGGDLRAYVTSLRRLQNLQVDYLLPGHPLMGSDLSSRLGEAKWRQLIEHKIAKLDALVNAHGHRLEQFLDGVPKALSPRLFYLGESYATATYVVQSTEGLICVDPGRRSDAELREQFQQLGLDVGNVKAVLLTGIHPDHSDAARALCDATGAKLYCGTIEGPVAAAAELSPFHAVASMESLKFGDVEIVAIVGATGAGADMCYFVRTPAELVLFGGDNKGRFEKPPNSHHADLDENTVASAADPVGMRFIASQPIDFVLPAHPELDELPFYAPGEWQARGRN